MEKVSIASKLSQFSDHWNPRIVGELNGQHVKLVKFQGEFVWHHHDAEDELFLVVDGRFRMDFRDRQVWLERGEFLIVPRGVEHRPVADEEVSVLLFEPAGTVNTGQRHGRSHSRHARTNLNSLCWGYDRVTAWEPGAETSPTTAAGTPHPASSARIASTCAASTDTSRPPEVCGS